MFNPVLEALFLRSRDQHAATGRSAHLAVLGLLLFHAAVLTPWVEHQHQLFSAASEEQRFSDLASEVAELGEATAGIGPAWQEAMTPALEQLVADLRQDLARLEVTRRQLEATAEERSATPEEGETPEGRTPEDETADRPDSDVRPLEIENPEWIAAIAEADNRYGLLAALEPAVEQLIVRPRFAELNRVWRNEALPGVEVALDASSAAVARLRGRFREAGSELGALEAALTNLRRVFRDLELRPPDEPYWWGSPETGESLDLSLPPEIERQLLAPVALEEARAAGELAAERQAALAGRVERERQRSLAARESRERRLAGFAATLAGVGIDLDAVAALFPLLLGLVLAGVMIRRNQRLRDLALATHAMLADGGGSDSLRDWGLAQLRGGAIDPASPGSASHGADAAWRSGSLRALGALFLALAWIALANLQVRGLPGLDDRRWLAVSVLGAAAVLIATVNRLLVARRLVVLLAAEPRSGGRAPEERPSLRRTPDGRTPAEMPAAEPAEAPSEPDEIPAESDVEPPEAELPPEFDDDEIELIGGHPLKR